MITGPDGRLTRITKLMDPALAHGEYIGATLIGAQAAAPLADALEATWRRDPSLYYEDGFQEFADRGGVIGIAPIGEVELGGGRQPRRPPPRPRDRALAADSARS